MADNTTQRQNVASAAVEACTALVDALYKLNQLKDQRSKFLADFQDGDFAGTNLAHLSAGIVGSLFDFVIPSLQANFVDQGNGGRNEQILLQVRKG